MIVLTGRLSAEEVQTSTALFFPFIRNEIV